MKLYSWNIYHRNSDPDRAFAFISRLDFDVLCLQEITEEFLMRLKTLPCNIAYGIDKDRLYKPTLERNYCVILSPHKIVQRREFSLPLLHLAWRANVLFFVMYPFGWRHIANNGSVFADIELPSGLTRVFCLHLLVSHPQQTAQEFDTAMALRETSLPTIVCGDLNVIESPRVSLFNWLLGGRLRDVLYWRNCRKIMENRFAAYGLRNPLRGTSTHFISNSQLDHILVPNDWRVAKADVLKDRLGSDHHPITVDCWP